MDKKRMTIKELFLYIKQLLEKRIVDGDELVSVCHSDYLDIRFIKGADIADLSEEDDDPQPSLMLEV